jgi:tetratricopeptide (TPR) repeat protein
MPHARLSQTKPPLCQLTHLLAALSLATGFALGVVPTTAFGASLAEAQQLLAAGQLPQALTQADSLIAANPKDPQYKFLRGVILTEQHKTAEAIQTFNQLTEQYPELPEPYNNLAVLYAQQGQYDKARAALDMAIRTNPSYATAFENLGDVYAKLASQSYQKALQLDGSKSDATQTKLALIRQLFSKSTEPQAAAKSAVVVAAAHEPARPVVPKPVVMAQPVPAPKPETVAPAVVAMGPAHAPAARPVPEAAPKAIEKPAPTEAKPAVVAVDASQSQVEQAVHAWAQAWASKNLDAYFGSYAQNFATPGNEPRSAWMAQRKARIGDKAKITVDVKHLQVKVDGDKATARFRQIYTAGPLNFDSPKTLQFQRVHGRWLIVQEIVA